MDKTGKNIIRIIGFSGLSVMLFMYTVFAVGNVAEAAGNMEEQDYIITTRSVKACREITNEYKENLADTGNELSESDKLVVIKADEEMLDKLSKDDKVISIEKDRLVKASGQEEDTGSDKLEWNLDILNLDSYKNHEKNSETGKIKVAVIDSGIDYSEDIDVKERKNFIPGEEKVSIIYEDATGHGTSIAGIIAAKDNDEGITGVNENVELYSAKVLDRNNEAPVSRIIEAIDWAIDQKVNILNLSFGTPVNSEALHNAVIQQFWKQQILEWVIYTKI